MHMFLLQLMRLPLSMKELVREKDLVSLNVKRFYASFVPG